MTPKSRATTVLALRAAAAKLMATPSLTDEASKTKAEAQSLLDLLSNDEKKVINHLAGPTDQSPYAYGGRRDGDYLKLGTVVSKKRIGEETKLGRVARVLVESGWLTCGTSKEESAFFHMTDAAKNLIDMLQPVSAAVVSSGELGRLLRQLDTHNKNLGNLVKFRDLIDPISSPDDLADVLKDIHQTKAQIETILTRLDNGHRFSALSKGRK